MSKNKNILVTGGLGYIGSHTVVELINSGFNPIIIDNLSNTRETILLNLEKITSREIQYYNCDVINTDRVADILVNHSITAVIHFAALKAVGESTEKPLLYYKNNVFGLVSVLEAMQRASVNKIVFSSSATVYGDPDTVPISEEANLKKATNPYGATKQIAEQIINDVTNASKLKAILLRYFNPIGAHKSGLIGELPLGVPNNLVPYVTQTAAGLHKELVIHGNDYSTPDGTGVRDYIHVVDLAQAHVAALLYVDTMQKNTDYFNLGAGYGKSVLEVIELFQLVNGVKLPYRIGPRRAGDIGTCFAAVNKAEEILHWKAKFSIEDALRDSWRWQLNIDSKI